HDFQTGIRVDSAHVVYGAIGAKYNWAGGPTGYGLPTSDEAWVPGLPGVRAQYFSGDGHEYISGAGLGGRAIYWSAATGAHIVYGALETEYENTGRKFDGLGHTVRQVLGAPTSDVLHG